MVCKVTNTKPNTKHLLTQQKSFLHQICSLITTPHSILHSRKPLQTSHPPHPKTKKTRLWWRFSVDSLPFLFPSFTDEKNPMGKLETPLPGSISISIFGRQVSGAFFSALRSERSVALFGAFFCAPAIRLGGGPGESAFNVAQAKSSLESPNLVEKMRAN